ncbi:MAG: efflux transporter outer membrane subunit [Proteobacteria bacterium]|nr:efflux transporter outer membrane subunit [Pseudomonadota bacterium]MBU1716646.1 efflux transporter outer membrane subunit [Pseudomonadota bacterium]
MKINLNIITFLLMAPLFAACAIFRPADSLPGSVDLPPAFSMYSEKADTTGEWWHDFKSENLDQLIASAISDNFSIKEAWARLAQAQYTAIKSGAARAPQLNYQAAAANLESKNQGSSQTNTTNWSLGFLASYEVDLWGRLKADQESTNLLTRAREEDLKTAMMTVTGEITDNWVRLVSNKNQQILFSKQLALQEKLLNLVKQRFPLAKSTALDIYQQQQAIEAIKTTMIPLAARENSLIRQLALLTGKTSVDPDRLPAALFPTIGELPALGLPADLLAARPDIRAAGLRLKSGQWEVVAAKADRLPALKLTATHTFSDQELGSIFDNWLLNLAANLTGPIFDGKRRRAEVERTKAIAEERIATYGKTVFTAIKEVEDALADEAEQSKTLKSLNNQLAISEKTVREAKRRYLNGNSDFLNVLREELNILKTQQNLIIAQENMIIARIKLYKALGGSWVDNYL